MAELRTRAGGLVQRSRAAEGGFGRAKRTRFLDVLAATCNVETAASEAGIWASTAHRLRRRDGEFARLWAAAVEESQDRLRERVIARALGQVRDEENPGSERAFVADAPFDPALALKILEVQARGGTGGERRSRGGPAPSVEAVHAALARRLDEAEARRARPAAPTPTPVRSAPEER